MEISNKQIYNLWDTNGRRNDILNAIDIYLNILKSLKDEGKLDEWAAYPKSLSQYFFYSRAIDASPEVFSTHKNFDEFLDRTNFVFSDESLTKKDFEKVLNSDNYLEKILDEAIEARARHYTSNLVKFGFATDKRNITPAGMAFINGSTNRDTIEQFLPINDTNLILLRQLIKLRIYSDNQNGKRRWYSPFFLTLSMFLEDRYFDKDDFKVIVQGLNPYFESGKIINLLKHKKLNNILDAILQTSTNIPIIFMLQAKISEVNFSEYIKNRKSKKTESVYYEFYSALYDFVFDKSESTYEKLKNTYILNKEKIKKAFCTGKATFDFGVNGVYSLEEFEDNNKENLLLEESDFNNKFYEYYEKSKYIDGLSEYSDTTFRILSATGLFKLKKIPELNSHSLIKIIFKQFDTYQHIFGESTENEYLEYEKSESSYFGKNNSLIDILQYDEHNVKYVCDELHTLYGTNDEKIISQKIENTTSTEFENYIKTSYPLKRVIYLLGLFADRKNDTLIKNEVNPSATVPTIYEYLIGIAWYYFSNCNFDLYASFNLTMNADFEPEIHAGGGMGDIVIEYEKQVIMLEVTLMNSAAQKKGEWEPVLRHSLNNKAINEGKETITFFIADELDFNTINIWRAVAAVPLRSTTGILKQVEGVVIMPLTNNNLIHLIINSISVDKLIANVRASFGAIPKLTDSNWHEEILKSLENC